MFEASKPVVWPGKPYPLGSTWDGEGVNFALYSEHAEKVELCLFDATGKRETARVELQEQTDMNPRVRIKAILHRKDAMREGRSATDRDIDCCLRRFGSYVADLRAGSSASPVAVLLGENLVIMNSRRRIPLATYRLQLNRDFTFAQATAIVPYLSALGISHCYVSPCLKARAGSVHGYDIVDHSSLNPELGTTQDFDRLVDTLHQHGMGLILDIVPNHMADTNTIPSVTPLFRTAASTCGVMCTYARCVFV